MIDSNYQIQYSNRLIFEGQMFTFYVANKFVIVFAVTVRITHTTTLQYPWTQK